jgi:hypothetical protein
MKKIPDTFFLPVFIRELGGQRMHQIAESDGAFVQVRVEVGVERRGVERAAEIEGVERAGKPVDLVITIDPVGVGNGTLRNADRGINFCPKKKDWRVWSGGGAYGKIKGSENIKIGGGATHADLDDNQQVQGRIIEEIGRVFKQPF